MPFIEQLIRDYTKINLDRVLKLKHSLTLYKWLCSWSDENKKENQRDITTKELKELLGLSIDTYVQNGKFNRADAERYTIKSAIQEINEKTNIIVSYKKNKIGNKIENYEFNCNQRNKTNGESNTNYTKENANKYQALNDKQI
ncbi:replication initiation protein [Spiroplasma endosymbiont of Polydrusus pterygomalis]|uniref:replication initiation protein n=1 Tax=Spiroplasma endosymbiont of Polydrusus pterygomalis TaxID=3139327 RepID=UPI003CCAF727